MARPSNAPVVAFVDPRVEVYAPTESFPYYRVVGYAATGKRVVQTSGGQTLRKAKAKAAQVSQSLRRVATPDGRDPTKVRVVHEVEEWLDPANHRSRGNRPWSRRHAENMRREWELRIAPQLSAGATVSELTEKHLWIRILNDAQASGLAPASVQKTGQACRSLVTGSWIVNSSIATPCAA